MKDSLAVLAISVAADMPDLAPFICSVIRLSGKISDTERNLQLMRLRATLKGFQGRHLSGADAFAALKVHVDDLADAV